MKTILRILILASLFLMMADTETILLNIVGALMLVEFSIMLNHVNRHDHAND